MMHLISHPEISLRSYETYFDEIYLLELIKRVIDTDNHLY